MTSINTESVRRIISDLLAERGKDSYFEDDESLFDSGRLDSTAAVNLLLTLEADLALDLSDPDFDISQIDTFSKISSLIEGRVS